MSEHSGQIKILCVDDEHNVLRALERNFHEDDYEIVLAALLKNVCSDILGSDVATSCNVSFGRLIGQVRFGMQLHSISKVRKNGT